MREEYPLGTLPEQQDREAAEDMARLAPEYWAHQRTLEEGARIEYAARAEHERQVELEMIELRRATFAEDRAAETAEQVAALPPLPPGLRPRTYGDDW